VPRRGTLLEGGRPTCTLLPEAMIRERLQSDYPGVTIHSIDGIFLAGYTAGMES
jgi:hypothetical protein